MSGRPTHHRDARGRVDLRCLDREAMERFVADQLAEGSATALRIYKEVWQGGVASVADMVTVRRELRERLDEVSTLSHLELARRLDSADGSIKFLWRLRDGSVVESVLIPDGRRTTLCMSSQVGCAMACSFCLTGDLGLKRHLDPAEIASQPLQVQRLLPSTLRITNLVLMGMGEPLHNLPNLIPALRICLDDHALNYSHRRITVSTVGLVPQLAELARALPVNLAVSLNASTDAQRAAMMPVNRRYPIADLLDGCRGLPLPSGKRIAFEYVMFAGINDALDDAQRLVDLLRDVPAKVNLIPYNENPDRPTLRRPSDAVVKGFQHFLINRGMGCTIRTTRGLDISAACGQLGKAEAAAEQAAAGPAR